MCPFVIPAKAGTWTRRERGQCPFVIPAKAGTYTRRIRRHRASTKANAPNAISPSAVAPSIQLPPG